MFSLILVLAIILLIVSVKSMKKHDPPEWTWNTHSTFVVLTIVSVFTIFGMVITICCLAPEVATEAIYDEKIAMYQEENAKIEQDIDRVVTEYMQHEHDTFVDIKAEKSSITLVTLVPELKSDKLVQQQLDIYVSNNQAIKELKNQKINLTMLKWLLYFGNN